MLPHFTLISLLYISVRLGCMNIKWRHIEKNQLAIGTNKSGGSTMRQNGITWLLLIAEIWMYTTIRFDSTFFTLVTLFDLKEIVTCKWFWQLVQTICYSLVIFNFIAIIESVLCALIVIMADVDVVTVAVVLDFVLLANVTIKMPFRFAR